VSEPSTPIVGRDPAGTRKTHSLAGTPCSYRHEGRTGGHVRRLRRPGPVAVRPVSGRAPRPAHNHRTPGSRRTGNGTRAGPDDPDEPPLGQGEFALPLDPVQLARLIAPERGRRYAALGLDQLQIAAAEDGVRAVLRREYRGATR